MTVFSSVRILICLETSSVTFFLFARFTQLKTFIFEVRFDEEAVYRTMYDGERAGVKIQMTGAGTVRAVRIRPRGMLESKAIMTFFESHVVLSVIIAFIRTFRLCGVFFFVITCRLVPVR